MTPFRPRIAALPARSLSCGLLLGLGLGLALGLGFATLWPGPRPVTSETAPETGLETGLEAAIGRALDATLVVRTPDGARFLGSAVLWRDGTLAVTNAHLLAGLTEVQVETRSASTARATLSRLDAERDLAILTLSDPLGPGLDPAPPPGTGAPVIALGAPLEAAFTATRGIVSARRQLLPAVPVRFLQHDAAINPGSSGGPLIDTEGRLIGINTRIADGSRFHVGIGYALPVDLVTALLAGDLPPVPQLGLALRQVTPALSAALGAEDTGLLVDAVTPGGAAARAGLRPGDILLAAGGQALTRPGDLSIALEAAGLPLPLRLTRATPGGAAPLDLSLDAPLPAPRATPRPTAAPQPARTTFAGLGVTLEGARVAGIDETGAAYAAGLSAGDVIEAMAGQPFDGDTALSLPALLRIRRGGTTTHILIDPARRTLRPLGGGHALDPDVTLF